MVLLFRAVPIMLTLTLAAAVLAAAPSPPGSRRPPHRIVSLDLCADQYLIALADPAQIAGLSRFARDPAMSFFAGRARSLPAASRSAEQVLMLRPDLLVGVPYRQRDALAPLAARGVPLLDLPNQDGLAGIEETILAVAVAVGHPERGTALIADIRAQLAAVGPPPGHGRVALTTSGAAT